MRKLVTLIALINLFLLGAGCSSSPTIAILTDFGWDDPYVGAMQGAILSINPDARMISITQSSPNYDIREASFILGTAAKEFPKSTIFLAVVDPGVGSSRRPIIVETLDGKYFVGPDNGIFTDVIRSLGLKRAIEVNNVLWFRRGALSTTFHGRDIFGPTAAHLSRGESIENAGSVIEDVKMFERVPAEFSEHQLTGELVHRDHYGNLITNIPAPLIAKTGWKVGMTLDVIHKERSLSAKFVDRYSGVANGEFLLIVNGQGLLELARYMDNAGNVLEAAAGDSVSVRTAGVEMKKMSPTPTSDEKVTAGMTQNSR